MDIDNTCNLIKKMTGKKLSWNQAETALHVTSGDELASVLSHADEVDMDYEFKEHHIAHTKLYDEDADMHSTDDKPLTRAQIIDRIKKSFHVQAKPISKKAFGNIKLVAKVLNKEAKQDDEAYDLSDLPNEEAIENELPNQETLGEFINGHCRDLLVAGNLDIYYDDSAELAFTDDENVPDDECLDINELSDKVNRLVKLGRYGIARLEERNKKLSRKIMKLQDEMNTIA